MERIVEQRMVEARGAHARGGQRALDDLCALSGARAQAQAAQMAREQQQKVAGLGMAGVDVQAQLLGRRGAGGRMQAQAQQGRGACGLVQCAVIDAQRRQEQLVAAEKAAAGAFHRGGQQLGASRDANQAAVLHPGREGHHGRGRQRKQVLGKQQPGEILDEFGMAVVELAPQQRGEKGGAFEQALDVGIGAAAQQHGGQRGVVAGEFGRQMLQASEFVLEVGVEHGRSRRLQSGVPSTRTRPWASMRVARHQGHSRPSRRIEASRSKRRHSASLWSARRRTRGRNRRGS